MFKNSITESNVKSLHEIPDLRLEPKHNGGPLTKKLIYRFSFIYICIVLIGACPFFLKTIGFSVSARTVACFMGFLIPGSGLIATGHLILIAIGVFFTWFTMTWGMTRNHRAGDKLWILLPWIFSIIGGLLANEQKYSFVWPLLAICDAVCIWYRFYRITVKYYRYQDEARKRREEYQDEVQALFDEYTSEDRPINDELTDEQLKAVRPVFDITTQPLGDFSNISFPKWSISEFRYQMCFAGYGLLMMMRRYTPNFRGYMQHSLRYIIESFISPQACEYWNVETVTGNFSLDFDPISPNHHDNIMLKGWIAPILTGYHALTGDDRYNQEHSLKFQPFRNHPELTFDYSVDKIVKVIIEDWKVNKLTFIPCEPNLCFSICNFYPMVGVQIFDNDFNTGLSKEVYDKYIKALKEEFVMKGGAISNRENNLIGFKWYPRLINESPMDFGTLAVANAIYPGLAKRNYVYFRKEFLTIDKRNNNLLVMGKPLTDLLKFEGDRAVGGVFIGGLEQAAAEFGDWELYDILQEEEKKYAPIVKDPLELKYKDMTFANKVCMLVAKWAQKGDWYNLAHNPVPEKAVNGPVLDKCKYPEVLVAKAVSNDGNDLELVIRNGLSAGKQVLGFSQLKPNTEYYDINHPETEFISDIEGKATVELYLDGRYRMHLVVKKP